MNKRIFNYFIFLAMIIGWIISVTLLFNQSIRLDESQSLWAVTKSLGSFLTFTANDVHVPLYGVILHLWVKLFGTDIVIARTLSLLFFFASLPILYLLAKESSNKQVGFITIAFFSLSPFIIWFSNEARMYTLFLFTTLLSHLFFLKFYRSNGAKGKFGYFISTVLGLYTHYFFIFLFFTQILFLFSSFIQKYYVWKQNPEGFYIISQEENKKILYRFLLCVISASIFFLPWVAFVIYQGSAANTQPLIPPPTSFNIFQTFVNFLFGFQAQNFQTVLVSLWPLLVIVLFLVFTQQKKIRLKEREYILLATFLPIILVFGISYMKPIFLSRYLILTTPTLFLMIAWVLMNYSKKISLIITTSLMSLMLVLLYFQNYSPFTPVKEDYAGVAHYLAKKTTPQDIITVSAPFTIYPLEYSYTGHTRIDSIPEWDRYEKGGIPLYSRESLIKQINTYKKSHTNLYVVLSYDQGYEKDIRTYLDKHLELEGVKKFSADIEVRIYKLRYDIATTL